MAFRLRAVVPLYAAACAAIACIPDRPVSRHADLSATADPLRTEFNADTGQIRVVMLVSPT